MIRKYGEKFLVLRDETFFLLSKSQMPENDRFYTKHKSTTPPKVEYKFKHKFEQKLMLYIAISNKGMSKPWFKLSGLAINQQVYQTECLQKNPHPVPIKVFFGPLSSIVYKEIWKANDTKQLTKMIRTSIRKIGGFLVAVSIHHLPHLSAIWSVILKR